MQRRRQLRGLMVAALALGLGPACKAKDADQAKTPPAATATAADLDARCDALAKTCGDTDKHVEKIVGECRQVAKQEVEKGCIDKAIALADCYARELCGKADKVWAFVDLPVLAARNSKCIAEQAAVDRCVGT